MSRYFIFDKAEYARTGVLRSMKNVVTREIGRNYKRGMTLMGFNGRSYGIFDRFNQVAIR